MPAGSSAYCSRLFHFQNLNRSLLFLILLCQLVSAASRNITIDDQHGDEETGAIPRYDPPEAWTNQDCQGCAIKPDVGKLFGHTATAATFMPDKGFASNAIEFGFNGTAIYIFFTLFNFEGQGVTVNTECNFTIDGRKVGFFNHTGDPGKRGARDYRAMVLSETNLSPEPHQMKISMSNVGYDLFLSFDYAIYTRDIDSSETPSPVALLAATSTASQSSDPSSSPLESLNKDPTISPGVIAGGVVGGLAVLTGFVLLIYFYRRDLKRDQPPKSPPITVPRPFGIDAYSSSERGQYRPYPHFPPPSNGSLPSLPPMSESSRSGRSPATSTPSGRSRAGYSHRLPSVDESASVASQPQSHSSRSGSVEHQIRVAHHRMRSIRVELASVSGSTAPSSQSGRTSHTRGSSSRVTEELLEEVKRLRQEIQVLKQQQQRQQPQPRRQPPADNEPPPTYTDEME